MITKIQEDKLDEVHYKFKWDEFKELQKALKQPEFDITENKLLGKRKDMGYEADQNLIKVTNSRYMINN